MSEQPNPAKVLEDLESPQEATTAILERGNDEDGQGCHEEPQGSYAPSVSKRGFQPGYDPRRGDPHKANLASRGVPRAPSLLRKLQRHLADHPEDLDDAVRALLGAAKDQDNRHLVDAHKVLLDRLDGPVVRQVETNSTSARVVIHGLAQGAQAPQGARAPTIGPGPIQGDPDSGVGALGGAQGYLVAPVAPVGPVPSVGVPVEPPSTGVLEARMGALEGQVGQMMQMLQMLVQQGASK